MELLDKRIKNIVGVKSRNFIVLEPAKAITKQTCAHWKCQCKICGIIKVFPRNDILRGEIRCRCHAEYARLKRVAKLRNIKFTITDKEMWKLLTNQERKCALSGLSIVFKNARHKTASLDRIDSKKGYTIDNVQWVHKDINRMKSSLKQNYFIKLCKLIYENNEI